MCLYLSKRREVHSTYDFAKQEKQRKIKKKMGKNKKGKKCKTKTNGGETTRD